MLVRYDPKHKEGMNEKMGCICCLFFYFDIAC
jgi:hypothetical protein